MIFITLNRFIGGTSMTNKIVCPSCKSETGFFTKERVTGSATVYYNSNGDLEEDQHAMYDSLLHYGGSKAYCRACEHFIGRTDALWSGDRVGK